MIINKKNMNNAQILIKAIEKNIKNGYKASHGKWFLYLIKANINNSNFEVIEHSYERVIFSHDFAKAFWGKKISKGVGKQEPALIQFSDGLSKQLSANFCYEWEYHLQQMVLEEEPLKYLEKFL